MPSNFSVPTNVGIASTTGQLIATSWSSLLSGTIRESLDAAGVFGPDEVNANDSVAWWSGSAANGTVSTTNANQCGGWADSNAAGAEIGLGNVTDGTWLAMGSQTCSSTAAVLCLCY